MAAMQTIDDFLGLLEKVKPIGKNQWKALCPSHHDIKESLSIKEADGKILLKCFAGCELADILKPLGLEPKDLFLKGRREKLTERQIDTIYHYIDEGGKPFEVVRTRPKGFYQRRPDGKGGYINDLKGIKPTLYHQEKLRQAIEAGRTIYFVEGEKDADRLWSMDIIATTNPMGAGKWRKNYIESLRGAGMVIIPDNDGPGHDHASRVAKSLLGVCTRVRILELPSEFSDISDWLDGGGNIKQLERLAAGCPDYELPPDDNLPEVLVGGRHLRDISAESLGALYRANRPEHIFRRSGALSRISLDEKARPFTEMLGESALRGCLARCCNFIRTSTNGNKFAVSPPLDLVRDIASLGEWQLPPLLGITEAPVMRPDGTVVDKPGYDEQTNLYYSPSPKLSVPPIPDKPTDADIKAAVEMTLEPICDFPFDSDASRANAVATMFTPILRPMIEGPVPLAIIDKPQAGTGASLLAETISLIATGRAAAMMTAQWKDEEWRKVIISLLLKGQLVATIDNIEQTVRAPSLAALLTATTYQDRILGRSEMIILPNRTTWIATGNNIKLAGDLPRRCIWIRMDAKMARPWLRDIAIFKHPHLMEWISDNRGALLAALLTIARAWAISGRPDAQGLPNLGGYEDYCRVVGGVLAFMGISGFLDNLDAMYKETDTETPEWEGFLEAWLEHVGEEPATAAEVIRVLNENEDFRASLPSSLVGKDAKSYSRRLGKALSRQNNVRYPSGLMVTKAGEKKRAITWQVVSFYANSPQFSLKGEFGEFDPSLRGDEKEKDNKNVYKKGTVPNSPNSPLASREGEFADNIAPPYPTHPCQCGCGDYWLTDDNRWLCKRCHPKPRDEE